MNERVRWQRRIEQLMGLLAAADRQRRRIQQANLHQQLGLVPIDVLVGDLTVFDSHDYHDGQFDLAAAG